MKLNDGYASLYRQYMDFNDNGPVLEKSFIV